MFYCAQCPGTFFATREALSTHSKISRQWHPYCWKCDIDFIDEEQFDKHTLDNHGHYNCFYCGLNFESEEAVEQHTLNKHGRYRCEVCDKGFETEVGRNRHYRNSSAHPTCSKCGCGYEDRESLRKHEDYTHAQQSCGPCGGRLLFVGEVEAHYLESLNHPVCSDCLVGFEDNFSYKDHMDSLHPEMQNYSVTVSDDGSATSEYPPEGSSNIHNHMSDDDLDNCGCTRGSVEGTEDEMSLWGIISGTDISARSDHERQSDSGDDSSTDVELPWTPALSDYESATEENDSMQHLEFSEYHLHTNSPAWAALFPLPDSPEIITAALPAKDPDCSPRLPRVTPISPETTSINVQDISSSSQMLSARGSQAIIVQPHHPAFHCAEAIDINGDDCYSSSDTVGSPRTPSVDSNSGKASPFYSPFPGSPRIEDFPELPSSPSSLLSSRSSGPNSPNTSEGSEHHASCLSSNTSPPKAPNVASWGVASTLSPQEDTIPFEFSGSIFEEKLSADVEEEDATWDVNDKVGFVRDAITRSQPRPFEGRTSSSKTSVLTRRPICKPQQLLHCRLCLREYCDDLTATMCGHVFCHSCITQSIMNNPQCPVCKAPTLLYCLFRIDLSI